LGPHQHILDEVLTERAIVREHGREVQQRLKLRLGELLERHVALPCMESPPTRTRRDPAGVYSRLEVDPADTDDLLRGGSDHGLNVPLADKRA